MERGELSREEIDDPEGVSCKNMPNMGTISLLDGRFLMGHRFCSINSYYSQYALLTEVILF